MKRNIVTKTIKSHKVFRYTETLIEVNEKEFIEEIEILCYNLKHYLKLYYLTYDLFNEHFKSKLTLLEWVILMSDNCIEIEYFEGTPKVNIQKFLNSDLCKSK